MQLHLEPVNYLRSPRLRRLFFKDTLTDFPIRQHHCRITRQHHAQLFGSDSLFQISKPLGIIVVNLACTKPKDLGLAAELWTLSALARYVANHAAEVGFPRLVSAFKATVWRILNEHDIKPHRIRYYLEKRDPEFNRKMREVLMVYQDVSLYPVGATDDNRPTPIYTVSVDEKPGVQAIGATAGYTMIDKNSHNFKRDDSLPITLLFKVYAPTPILKPHAGLVQALIFHDKRGTKRSVIGLAGLNFPMGPIFLTSPV